MECGTRARKGCDSEGALHWIDPLVKVLQPVEGVHTHWSSLCKTVSYWEGKYIATGEDKEEFSPQGGRKQQGMG